MTIKEIIYSSLIQIGMEFQNFILSNNKETVIDLSIGTQKDVPLEEITLGDELTPPPLKGQSLSSLCTLYFLLQRRRAKNQ